MGTLMGRKLCGARMEAGYRNAVEFGKLLGKTDRMIRRYENGDTVPGVAVLQRWAELTGKSVEYFLEQPVVTEPHPAAPPIHPGVNELAKNLRLRKLHSITDEEIEDARQLIPPGREPMLTEDSAFQAVMFRRQMKMERQAT